MFKIRSFSITVKTGRNIIQSDIDLTNETVISLIPVSSGQGGIFTIQGLGYYKYNNKLYYEFEGIHLNNTTATTGFVLITINKVF